MRGLFVWYLVVAKEFFKFGPLIVKVEHTSVYGMFRVVVLGEGQEFETFIPGKDDEMAAIAYSMIEELNEAAAHPSLFLARRRMAANKSDASAVVRERMIELSQQAARYAKRIKDLLAKAAKSMEEGSSKRMG